MAIEIRAWRPGDEQAVRDLFEASFARRMSGDFWTWRFRDHPAGGPAVMLAWDGDRLAAHYGASRAPLVIDGETVPALLSMTTMTHPDYRGRGLLEATGSALYETVAAEGCCAVWGFPNALINATRQTKLGWVPICDVATLTVDLTRAGPRGAAPTDRRGEIVETGATDERFARLATRIAVPGTIRGARDAATLAWRIDRNPVNRYTRLVLPEGDEIAGYAICKPYGAEALDLVELATDSAAGASVLIAAVAARAAAQGRFRVNAWCLNRDPNRLAYERFGFVADAPVTYLGGRALAPLGADIADPRPWRLAMLDSDLY